MKNEELELEKKLGPITVESLNLYISNGILPGGFLKAVLENNLFEAMGWADSRNRHLIFDICTYIYNYLPSDCHGSPKIVATWVTRKTKQMQAETKGENHE